MATTIAMIEEYRTQPLFLVAGGPDRFPAPTTVILTYRPLPGDTVRGTGVAETRCNANGSWRVDARFSREGNALAFEDRATVVAVLKADTEPGPVEDRPGRWHIPELWRIDRREQVVTVDGIEADFEDTEFEFSGTL